MNASEIIRINKQRIDEIKKPYNPITGEGACGEREHLIVRDAPYSIMHLPKEMMQEPFVVALKEYGTIRALLKYTGMKYSDRSFQETWLMLCELRYKYDFEYYAMTCLKIRDKITGGLIHFKLNRGQRRLLAKFEEMRLKGLPIRVILLKARQYGGSTLTQLYMNWIQMVHKKNWNSVICAHINQAAVTIRTMFEEAINNMVPIEKTKYTFKSYQGLTNVKQVPERECQIIVGSAETPDSVRSMDAKMCHFSEVTKYPNTDKKETGKLIGSIVGTIPKIPYTFICFESTANGIGDYFHNEWMKAKNGKSSYEPCFVPWYEIDNYSDEFDGTFYNHDGKKEKGGAIELIASFTDYEANLFHNHKCTLEAINWYRGKMAEMPSAEEMQQDYPSDDIEAFLNSGMPCFRTDHIEALRGDCTPPLAIGDLIADSSPQEARIDSAKRKLCLKNIQFIENTTATAGFRESEPKLKLKHELNRLKIWEFPDKELRVSNRYIVTYDPSKGVTSKADFGVIRVIDRYYRMYGGVSEIVAEWKGHEDKDIAIWIATQIAEYYNRAKLVVETNTYDSVQKDDDSEFIFGTISDYYSNLYSRTPMDKVVENAPIKYGFNTNRQTKPAIIANYVAVLREKLYVERNEDCLNEARYYEKNKNGRYGAKSGYHDDCLMATMIGLWVDFEMPIPKILDEESKVRVKKIENNFSM